MQAYVMSGIAGVKVNLEADLRGHKCDAKVPGYASAVAHLPIETCDAVLTAGGMLVYRNRANKVQAVMIENHQDVIRAAEEDEKSRRQTATVCKGTIRADKITAGTISVDKVAVGTIGNYNAAKHGGFGTIMTREEALSMLSPLTPALAQGQKAAMTKIEPGKITITDAKITDVKIAGSKVQSLSLDQVQDLMAPFIVKLRQYEKKIAALGARIVELEAEAASSTSRATPPDLDRTCTESGGLFMGPTSTVSDNPFVRKNKTGQ